MERGSEPFIRLRSPTLFRGFPPRLSFALTQRLRGRSSQRLFDPLAAHQLFKMKVVAAYLLALLGGNSSPSAKDIEAILGSGAKP